MTLWDLLLWFLTWLSAEPAAMDAEHPRAAAAVAAARASMTADDAPAPPTPPAPGPACPCEGACNGTGTWKPDGRIIKTCPAGCPCKPAK